MEDSEPMTPSLPLDVLVSILDLDKEDATTLRVWTLVSPHLLPFARSHLYRTIDMRNYSGIAGERLFARLHRHISNNPHLGPFVRNLHFLETDVLHPYMTLSCEHRDFPNFLKLLPAMECFGLYFKETISWQDRSRAFVMAIEELGRRPSFKELCLSGIIRLPISVLNGCPFLKRLYLENVTFIDPFDAIRFTKSTNEQGLTTLESRMVGGTSIDLEVAFFSGADMQIFDLHPPVSQINFSKLGDLAINFDFENFDLVWAAIHSVQQSLRRLELGQTTRALGHSLFLSASFLNPDFTPPSITDIPVAFATLNPLTNLSHLSIVIAIPNTRSRAVSDRIMSEWCSLLRTAHKGIQTISITLNLTFFGKSELYDILSPSRARSSSDSKGKNNPSFLARLDEVLTDLDIFPTLSGVAINVRMPNSRPGPWPELTDIIQVESESSPESDDDVFRQSLNTLTRRTSIKSEELKVSVIRMMKLTRKRFEGTVRSGVVDFKVCVA